MEKISRKHGLSYHFYADDSQLYLFFKPNQEQLDDAVYRTERCAQELRTWPKTHFLKCHDDKTEVLLA